MQTQVSDWDSVSGQYSLNIQWLGLIENLIGTSQLTTTSNMAVRSAQPLTFSFFVHTIYCLSLSTLDLSKRTSKSGHLYGCVFNVAQKMAALLECEISSAALECQDVFITAQSLHTHSLYRASVWMRVDWLVLTAKIQQQQSRHSPCIQSISKQIYHPQFIIPEECHSWTIRTVRSHLNHGQ